MAIKYILFDNNGVLTTNHKENVDADLAKAAGVSKKEMRNAVLKHCVPLDKGLISDVEFSIRVLRTVGSQYDPKELSRIRLNAYHPKKDVMRFAKQLSKRYKIGLLSNFGRSYDVADKKWRLSSIFNGKRMFLSFRLRMCKPNKNIFKIVVRKLRCKPNEIIFIDDSRANIKSASELGIVAIHFTTLPKLKKALATHEIIT